MPRKDLQELDFRSEDEEVSLADILEELQGGSGSSSEEG